MWEHFSYENYVVSGQWEGGPWRGDPAMSLETRDTGKRVSQQIIHAGKMSDTLKISRFWSHFQHPSLPVLRHSTYTGTHCLTEPLVRAYCMNYLILIILGGIKGRHAWICCSQVYRCVRMGYRIRKKCRAEWDGEPKRTSPAVVCDSLQPCGL